MCSVGEGMPTNMLPTALIMVPLILFSPEISAGLVIGTSTAFLVWGLIRDRDYWRLAVLLAFPFWHCVQVANWTISLLAISVIPNAYPLLVLKPHAGLPVAVLRFHWQGILIGSIPVLVSFALIPDWPVRWWATARTYSGGPLILQTPWAIPFLIVILRWRFESARYLIMCLLAPLRAFYDYLLLFALPQTPNQLMILVISSWIMYLSWYYWPEVGAPLYVLLGLYLPCLLWIVSGRLVSATIGINSCAGDVFVQGWKLKNLISKRSNT